MKNTLRVALAVLVSLASAVVGLAAEVGDDHRVASSTMVEGFSDYGPCLLSALIAVSDQTLKDEARVLKTLAETPVVRSGEWEKMRDVLKSSQPAEPLGIIWYARPDGSYSTVDAGPATQSLSDRPYFPSLMKGETVPGALVVSKATGKKSVVVAVPVREGEKIIGALGISIFLDRFSQRIDRALSLPPSMVFYALNADGVTVLHRDPGLLFEDPRKRGGESLREAGKEMLAREAADVEYEYGGYKRRVISQTSPLTQWRFCLGIATGVASGDGSTR